MLTGQFAKRTNLVRRVLQYTQGQSRQANRAQLVSVPTFSKHSYALVWQIPSSCYSVMTSECETPSTHCNGGNTNKSSNAERPYQVVVAATRDMGIGKDGKLPWNLPSDLRFFKDLTTATSIAGKRNAVIMGRKTWESIPLKYQPLPNRLNVVLTRSGKLETPTSKDLLICRDLPFALKLLAAPPNSVCIEKVFVIGGGRVLKEALNAPGCEAIHLTDIATNIECDTFIPRIDLSLFGQSWSSGPMVENDIQFCFKTYVRARNIS